MHIYATPMFVAEVDKDLIAGFKKLCALHYSRDVKDLCSVFKGGYGPSVNGPVTIAEFALSNAQFEATDERVTMSLTMRELDIVLKGMEMVYYVESAALRTRLIAFQMECKRAMQAIQDGAIIGWHIENV